MNGGWRRRWRDGADDFVKGIYVNFSMPRCTQMTVEEMGPKRVWPEKVSSKVGRGVGGYRRQSCSHIVIVVICSLCVCVCVGDSLLSGGVIKSKAARKQFPICTSLQGICALSLFPLLPLSLCLSFIAVSILFLAVPLSRLIYCRHPVDMMLQ